MSQSQIVFALVAQENPGQYTISRTAAVTHVLGRVMLDDVKKALDVSSLFQLQRNPDRIEKLTSAANGYSKAEFEVGHTVSVIGDP
ncbi:hypothetical protein HK104_011398, partial [Borealophlyctis nickersoniae]